MDNNEEITENVKVFRVLKSRIKATRKSRIEASKRLRKKHNYFEKISYFYSLIVLVLSIWFLNNANSDGILVAKILLIVSLSLTFFTMFLSIKNYKERAGAFESNYQELDILTNKVDRYELEENVITPEVLKEFQREYEKIIIGKENHLNIDFYVSTKENKEKFKKEIRNYNIIHGMKLFLVAVYPILLLLLIYLFEKMIATFNFV